MTDKKFYTGVGSRKAPQDVLEFLTRVAQCLAKNGYTVRTGDAAGCDAAFRKGAGFARAVFGAGNATEQGMALAKKFHPAWDYMSPYAQRLHGRNALQVLGTLMDNPSEFLICWTPDGAICHEERSIHTGGTGTAISIADLFEVTVYNVQREDHRQLVEILFTEDG